MLTSQVIVPFSIFLFRYILLIEDASRYFRYDAMAMRHDILFRLIDGCFYRRPGLSAIIYRRERCPARIMPAEFISRAYAPGRWLLLLWCFDYWDFFHLCLPFSSLYSDIVCIYSGRISRSTFYAMIVRTQNASFHLTLIIFITVLRWMHSGSCHWCIYLIDFYGHAWYNTTFFGFQPIWFNAFTRKANYCLYLLAVIITYH